MKRLWKWVIKYQPFLGWLIFSIIGAGGFIWLSWKLLWDLIDQDAIRNLILLAAGIIGWFFLIRRTKAIEQDVEIAAQNLTIDRLNRAIQQLDSEKVYVRLGGITGLEQIATTQDRESKRIARILVSFIRTRATEDSEEVELKEENEFDAYRAKRLDIETAVNALARIASKLERQEQFQQHGDKKQDLCNLESLDLRGLRLENANLSRFNLAGTDFSGTWMRRVNFTGALLFKITRTRRKFSAIFFRAFLDQANFTDAYMNGAIFTKAQLVSAKFDNVVMQNVILNRAIINNAHFENSRGLTQEQINKASYWGGDLHLPDGLELPPIRSPFEWDNLF